MHLAEAADTVEKSSCNNHWAVNQVNAARHKLESTGTSWSPPALGESPVPDTVALSLTPWLIFRKANGKPHGPFPVHELTELCLQTNEHGLRPL
jgi:hypothetical protein